MMPHELSSFRPYYLTAFCIQALEIDEEVLPFRPDDKLSRPTHSTTPEELRAFNGGGLLSLRGIYPSRLERPFQPF